MVIIFGIRYQYASLQVSLHGLNGKAKSIYYKKDTENVHSAYLQYCKGTQTFGGKLKSLIPGTSTFGLRVKCAQHLAEARHEIRSMQHVPDFKAPKPKKEKDLLKESFNRKVVSEGKKPPIQTPAATQQKIPGKILPSASDLGQEPTPMRMTVS